MVDVETTGVDPVHNAMIQIAAVRFNYETQEIGPTYVGYLTMPESRFWDQDTLAWWQKNQSILNRILDRGRPAGEVWNEFVDWTLATSPSLAAIEQRLWAKPISFEWPYLQSYGRQFGRALPFHYRNAVDLNSFCRGLAGDPSRKPLDKEIPFTGEQHDALDDTFHQVLVALSAKELLCPSSIS